MEIFVIICVVVFALLLVGRHLRHVMVDEQEQELKWVAPEQSKDSDPVETVPAPEEESVVIEPTPEPDLPEVVEPEPDPEPEQIDVRAIFHLESHRDGGWQVKYENAIRPLRVFQKKPEALAYAKTKAKAKAASTGKTSLLVVHKRDGSVQQEHAYDGDK